MGISKITSKNWTSPTKLEKFASKKLGIYGDIMNEPGKLYGKYNNQISNKNAGRLPIQMLFDAGTSINRSIQILGVVPSKKQGICWDWE